VQQRHINKDITVPTRQKNEAFSHIL
jgi:hypothetical protein